MRGMPLTLLMLLTACAPKAAGPARLGQPTDAAWVGLLAPLDAEGLRPLPESLDTRLVAALATRNLTARAIDPAATTTELARVQNTPRRLAWLAEHADGAPLLVLVEATAVYNTQMEGRFRWTVEVTASAARADDLAGGTSKTFKVPVFLQFVHDDADDALTEAGLVIERQVGRMLDGWLGGQP